MRDGSVDFDPRKHRWRFVGYYKYRFSFEAIDRPEWHASYGGDRDQIYTYTVSPLGTWSEITEGTCESDAEIEAAMMGDHEFAYVFRVPKT